MTEPAPGTTVAQDAVADPAATPRSVSPEHVEWLAQVDKDLRRTFPGHRAMQREGRASLRRVLAAYAVRNPAVGYCQGLNFVAGTFLLFLPEEPAFWCVCAVVERVLPGYFSAELEAPALDARILGQLLRGFFPATAAHLRALEVDIGSLTLHWFLCLFVTSLPTETCLRVWDLIFLEGHPVALFRVALALVDVFNGALVETRESSDAYMLLQALAPMSFDASRLVDTACIAFRGLQPAAVEVLRDKFRREVAEQVGDKERAEGGGSVCREVYVAGHVGQRWQHALHCCFPFSMIAMHLPQLHADRTTAARIPERRPGPPDLVADRRRRGQSRRRSMCARRHERRPKSSRPPENQQPHGADHVWAQDPQAEARGGARLEEEPGRVRIGRGRARGRCWSSRGEQCACAVGAALI